MEKKIEDELHKLAEEFDVFIQAIIYDPTKKQSDGFIVAKTTTEEDSVEYILHLTSALCTVLKKVIEQITSGIFFKSDKEKKEWN